MLNTKDDDSVARRRSSTVVRTLLVTVLILVAAAPGVCQERASPFLLGAYYYPWYRGERVEGRIGWMRNSIAQ